MNDPISIPFTTVTSSLGEAGFSPLLPLTIFFQDNSVEVNGLLDTGATVNVLPFFLGKSLRLDWRSEKIPLQLTGNLANYEARAVLLSAKISEFATVKLAFA